jgi:hypothetical protein
MIFRSQKLRRGRDCPIDANVTRSTDYAHITLVGMRRDNASYHYYVGLSLPCNSFPVRLANLIGVSELMNSTIRQRK